MTDNEKWNEFLKNGSVLAYLSYVASIKSPERSEKAGENSNSGTGNKGDGYR